MASEKDVLEGMPAGIRTTTELRKRFAMSDTNMRRVLKRLAAKGYVVKEEINIPGALYNNQTVGWRKLPLAYRKKTHSGMHGGLAKADTTPGQHRKDIVEVRTYLANNPTATVYDVSLECHMTDQQAKRLMRWAGHGSGREAIPADV